MDSIDEDGYSPNCSKALLQPSLCRQDQLVPIKLESLDQQQLGSRDSDKGISHSSHIQSCPANTTALSSPSPQRSDSFGGRDQITLAETSDSTPPYHTNGVLFQHVHGTQERWRLETCHQPQTSEPIREIRAFQDGGPTDSQSSSSEE